MDVRSLSAFFLYTTSIHGLSFFLSHCLSCFPYTPGHDCTYLRCTTGLDTTTPRGGNSSALLPTHFSDKKPPKRSATPDCLTQIQTQPKLQSSLDEKARLSPPEIPTSFFERALAAVPKIQNSLSSKLSHTASESSETFGNNITGLDPTPDRILFKRTSPSSENTLKSLPKR